MPKPSYGAAFPDAFSIFSGYSYNQSFLSALSFGAEEYTRTLWFSVPAEPNIKQWGIIGRGTHKRTTTIAEMKARSEGSKQGDLMGGMNLFFTPNQFFGWRKSQLLSQLHANYIDIDTKSHGTVTDQQSKLILRNALAQLKEAGVPSPNAIIASGSGGWHLYWLYDPIPGYKRNQSLWRLMANKLTSAIKSNNLFTVDTGASCDPTRLLRLPGSFHLSAQDSCECVYLSDLYDFDLLCRALEVEQNTPTSPIKKQTKHAATRKPKHTFKDYYGKIYFQLLEVANAGLIKKPAHDKDKGNRDMFLFLAMVCLNQIKGSSEDAFNEVLKLNQRYGLFVGDGPKSSPSLVRQYLSSCFKTVYIYSREKICIIFKNHFGVDIEHIFSQPKVSLSRDELAKRQIQSALATHKARKDRTRSKITEALHELCKQHIKPTMKAVAALADVSVRTISNHQKFYREKRNAIWSASIYTPQG